MTEAPHIPLIVEVHAEETAILWLQRDRAVDAPHFNRMFLARLDERVEANLDGLRVAGRAGWEIARAAFDKAPEPGEAFTLAALAFGAGSARGIGEVCDIVDADADGRLTRAAVSGLGWLDPRLLNGRVQPLLDDRRPRVRALGLGACSVHRVDPREQLARFLDDEPAVRAGALKLAGQMGRIDLGTRILPDADTDGACRFRAAWAAVLLGDRRHALDALRRMAGRTGPFQVPAFDLAVAASPPDAVRAWLRDLGQAARPLAVRAAGLMGQVDLIPWLIDTMHDPQLGRSAGESFAMITGADLEFLDLDGPAPEGAPTGPTDLPSDTNVELDPDADLCWPNPAAVSAWWSEQTGQHAPGARRFLGRPASPEVYLAGFDTGYQRQRRAAALAIACHAPGQVLPNWRKREPLRVQGSR